jgi:arginyl-tRNA synthetase
MTPGQLAEAVRAAVRDAVTAGELAVPVPDHVPVEPPKRKEHGDYATAVALQLAKPAGRPPRAVAEVLAARLRDHDGIADVEIAGPGFLNVRLSTGALGEVAREIVLRGRSYGCSRTNERTHINLEFVSANPTGPIHIGGVRWAAVGDALARLFEATGADVEREYYFNDAGAQIDKFAASLHARAHGRPVPEDGYGGEYIDEIARTVVESEPGLLDKDEADQLAVFHREGVALMFGEIKASLADFGVVFDTYFSEATLHAKGELDLAVERLRAGGHVYEQDGAVWLRTTDFGDDKDRVLTRSTGEPTYFAADAAYYLDKRERGFDRCFYLLGADHHGYVQRLRALAACFGDDPDRNIEVLIGQLVSLVRDGEPVRMSKRAGTVITLEDLVEAVGADAGRYALARASIDTTLEIDLDLWARRSSDNPVFYVQYAHARIASLLRNAAELGLPVPDAATAADVDVSLLGHERETDLLRALGELPSVVAAAAELRAPHRVARYLEEQVAPTYHRFYDACRVLPMGDEPATPLTAARLLLCEATRTVLANGLTLLGVSAPERM